jgi:putative membrane protein
MPDYTRARGLSTSGHFRFPLPESGQTYRAACRNRATRRILSAMATTTKRERSLVKGAVAGLIGGLAGAGAKMLAERIFPPRTDGQVAPPAVLAERFAGRSLPEDRKRAAAQAMQWGFGAVAGAVYGAMVEAEPSLGAWKGAAFGLTLNKLTHETLLPRMGLSVPKDEQPAQERVSEWVTHAVYGIFTDTVRRGVRRAL